MTALVDRSVLRLACGKRANSDISFFAPYGRGVPILLSGDWTVLLLSFVCWKRFSSKSDGAVLVQLHQKKRVPDPKLRKDGPAFQQLQLRKKQTNQSSQKEI